MTKIERFENLLLSLWVGAMAGIGYIAAPVLFKILDDRKLAGALAGEMFSLIGILGLIVGLLLLLSYVLKLKLMAMREWRFWVLLLMFFLVIASQFVIQPYMAELKLQGLIEGSQEAKRFGMMHGVSSTLYLLTNLFGMLLIILGLHPRGKRLRAKDISQF